MSEIEVLKEEIESLIVQLAEAQQVLTELRGRVYYFKDTWHSAKWVALIRDCSPVAPSAPGFGVCTVNGKKVQL